jgi:hypothetical protein
VALSRLVSGGLVRDPSTAATGKVSTLFNQLMMERGDYAGWSVKIHPSDNLLVVNVPATPNKPQEQLAMSLATKGWSRFRGIPMSCMDAWRGTLYFGTADGKVCRNDGYSDGADLSGNGSYQIDCTWMTAYSNLGAARQKRIHMVRPYFATGTAPGYSTSVRWDFDISDPGPRPEMFTPGANAWGRGLWGQMKWGGTKTAHKVRGTTGVGTNVAIVLRMSTKANVTLVGMDVVYEAGGFL